MLPSPQDAIDFAHCGLLRVHPTLVQPTPLLWVVISKLGRKQLPALRMSAHADAQGLNKLRNRRTVLSCTMSVRWRSSASSVQRASHALKKAPRVEPRMDTWQPNCFSLAGRWRERHTAPSSMLIHHDLNHDSSRRACRLLF